MYAPPYALRSTTHRRGTVAAAYAWSELRTVSDHPAPLEVLAGLEAGRVHEGDDRHVERVAPLHEATGLLRRLDVQRAGARERLVRDDAHRTTVEVAEPDDDGASVVGAELEERVGVEDVAEHGANVVRGRWRGRHRVHRFGAVTIDDVIALPRRRVVEVVRRKVRKQDRKCLVGVVLVFDDERSHAAVAPVHQRPTERVVVERDSGELGDGIGTTDVREGVEGHDHVVDETQAERGTGHARARDHDDRRHDARRVDERTRAASPSVQRADALTDVRAGGVEPRDERQAELGRETDRPLHRLGTCFADRAVVLAALDPELDDLPVVPLDDARRRTVAAAVHDRSHGPERAGDHAIRNHATGWPARSR